MKLEKTSGQAARLIAAGCMAVALQGCVAVAFPIAAGGLLAGGARMDAEAEGAPSTAVPTTVPTAVPTAFPPAAPPAGAETTVPVTENPPAIAKASAQPAANENDNAVFAANEQEPTIAAEEKAEVQVSAPAEIVAESTVTPLLPTEASAIAASRPAAVVSGPAPAPAPAPTPRAAPAPGEGSGIVIPVPRAAPAVAGATFFDPLFAYASEPAFMRSDARASAVLVDPTALKPDRIECAEGASMVLIDLDPKEGELFPIDSRSASPALAERLAQLRVKGIGIAWISQSSADRADEIRAALFQSGLDPLGTDEVLLMRYPDERKQIRRDELARNACLIAMAGDTRSDFHELFEYLLNPGDAAALEPLIGEGWFLIPTPLLSESTAP